MTRDALFHKNILVSILKDVFRDTSLAPFLGFKEGTAAMLFYELPRFSVDLDFDLLDEPDETVIFEGFKKHIVRYGTIKKADTKRYTIFFLLSYDGKMEGAANIKVDINKRKYDSEYHIMSFLGIPMRVIGKADMAAHKLLAMVNRLGNANRDIYDVWYFLSKQWPVNEKVIALLSNMSYVEFLEQAINALEKFDDRQILIGLGELLTPQQRIWVQANLKSEALFLLRLALRNTGQSERIAS
jgi:predicted nucleotidyltransferase component of viral defense system